MSIILTVVLLLLVLWLCLMLILVEVPSFRVIWAMRKLKGPKGIPLFIGLALDLMKRDSCDVLDFFNEKATNYPRVSAWYMAGIPFVLLQKPQDLRLILGSSRHIQKGFEYGPIIPWLKEGLLTSNGSKWHTRRKMLTPTFHFKILEDALSGMTKNTEVLTDKLSDTKGSSVVVDDYITRCTLDIIGETAMGVQLKSQTVDGCKYVDGIKKVSELILLRIISVFGTKDFIYNLTSMSRHFYKKLKILHEFTDKVIAERKENHGSVRNTAEDAFGRKSKNAFLDSLIAMQRMDPQNFSDEDIREEVDTFMFEGHDTTSAALNFGLWLLGSHPEVQEKLYKEIEETVGEGELTMTNINSMNYLEKVIKETLRLYPSVPYISRKINEDVYLDGDVMLPAGVNIAIIPFLLHRDPELYSDPEKFDPERFTEENSINRHPYAYIPFSAGPRNCVGQKFALLQMKVILVSLVRTYRIEALTKKEEFKIMPHLIIRPTVPIKCRFIIRTK